jgi:hypothetical protein
MIIHDIFCGVSKSFLSPTPSDFRPSGDPTCLCAGCPEKKHRDRPHPLEPATPVKPVGDFWSGNHPKKHGKHDVNMYYNIWKSHQYIFLIQNIGIFVVSLNYMIWLVVEPPLWKMMEFVSWDDDIPNIWKHKKCSKPPTSDLNMYCNILKSHQCMFKIKTWAFFVAETDGWPHQGQSRFLGNQLRKAVRKFTVWTRQTEWKHASPGIKHGKLGNPQTKWLNGHLNMSIIEGIYGFSRKSMLHCQRVHM